MTRYNEMIAAIERDLTRTLNLLEQRTQEMRSLNEQATQMKRALDALQAVTDAEDSFDAERPYSSLPRTMSLLNSAKATKRAEMEQATVRQKVLAILRSQLHPISRAEVVARLRLLDEHVNESTIASTLSKLIGNHGVQKNADNGYFVVQENNEGPEVLGTTGPSPT